MDGIRSYFWSSKPVVPAEEAQIPLVQIPEVKLNSDKTFKAEEIDYGKILQDLLAKIQNDPELKKELQEKLDRSILEQRMVLELLEEDLESSKIILSDEKKGKEWREKVAKLENENQQLRDEWCVIENDSPKIQDKSDPWRWYHLLTVPAKGVWYGYRIITKVFHPVAAIYMIMTNPWGPVLLTALQFAMRK